MMNLRHVIAVMALCLPLIVQANSVNTAPYTEAFENYSRGMSLAGTNGWDVGGGSSAIVTNIVAGSAFRGLFCLETNHEYSLEIKGSVTNWLRSPTNTEVWLDMLVPPGNEKVYLGGADGKRYVGFWRTNTTGRLVVHHSYYLGGTRYYKEDELAGSPVIGADEWVRINVRQSYALQTQFGFRCFQLRVNGALQFGGGGTSYRTATNELQTAGSTNAWFAMLESNVTCMGAMWITAPSGTVGYVDDIAMTMSAPSYSAIPRGSVTISGVDTNANRAGYKPGILQVNLNSATNRQIWAAYQVSGSAVPGVDYTPLSGLVGIPAGETSAQIVVVPTRTPTNAVDVVVTLVSNAYVTVGSASSLVVRISNTESALTRRQRGPCSRRTGMVISEIMYHPLDRTDGRAGEFVELYNSEPVSTDIGGWSLAGDISYEFPAGTVVEPQSYLIVARNPDAYMNLMNVVGPYAGNLGNGIGVVQLKNKWGALLLDVQYSSAYPWPASADGAGHSLVLAKPDYGEGDIRAWSASSKVGGSPGNADFFGASAYDGVVVNEIVAHTDPPLQDSIELYNGNSNSVNLGGCWLSDAAGTNKYRITDGTMLGPKSHVYYTQSNFVFGLSMAGGGIYLVSSNGDAVIDAIKYSAQSNGASYGRYPSGAAGFQTLSSRTLGSSNSVPWQGSIVINELMYHPISGNDDDQYLELYNNGAVAIDLGYWRFTEGIDYIIPPETIIAASNYLVIAKNVTNLLAKHVQLNTGNTVGNFVRNLSDKGERVVLSKPDDLNLPYQDYVIQDEVSYMDGWGDWTDGGGSSLELRDPYSDNSIGMNWAGSDETQKSTNLWTTIDYTDSIDNGLRSPNTNQIFAISPGEYIVDNMVMTTGSTTNLFDDFEGGATGWVFSGSHVRSSVDVGVGYGGSKGLHIRASERGEFSGSDFRYENHVSKTMAITPVAGQIARMRAKVRWLCGFPYLIIGCRGYWFATPGDLLVPANLGSPGMRNSRYANAGPAIDNVVYSPVLPAASADVIVTCGVSDPDGISTLQLKYRVDPLYVTNTVAMRDDGTAGDALAGDGIHSAKIPGQTSGTIVAFTIEATDGAALPVRSRYPSKEISKAPPTECLVGWGLSKLTGGGIPSYRLLMTATNSALLASRGGLSKELVDCTFFYDDVRAVQNAGGRYRGGVSISGYTIRLPGNDRVMGGNKLTVLSGGDINRIRYLPWLCRELGVAEGFMRPVGCVNGVGSLTLLTDLLTPSTELCGLWFADPDPEVFKNQDWNGDAFGFYTNAFGQFKKSIYAARQTKRTVLHPNDDYTQVFKIAAAVATVDDAKYVCRVNSVIDVRSWASYFAFLGLLSDTDHYGYVSCHNYYVYIPRHGYSQLLLHDMDWSFNTTPAVRWPTGHAVPNRIFVNTPAFKRAYWSILKDGADGPMLPEHSDKFYDDWYNVYVNNGFAPSAVSTFKTYIAGARTAIYAGLASVDAPFEITTSGGADFAAGSNPVTLNGTAPVHVEQIQVNGNPYYVEYTSLTNWQLRVWLNAGANTLTVSGYDHPGSLVGSDSVTVTYTGPDISPVGKIVINEIMYNPTVPYASFVELYNNSTNTLSLEGLNFGGISCLIGCGRMIAPLSYAVVAGNIPGYQCAYTNAEVVVAEFAGALDNGGETLRLLMPDGVTVVDEVTYSDSLPWAPLADGGGASLQLRDASKDNSIAGNWAVDVTRLYTPGEANSVTSNLPAFDQVWINEIMPTNTVFADNEGEYAPWVELYNAGVSNVMLGGSYYLANSYTNLTNWAFPTGLEITNGKYLLVWADGQTWQGTNGNLHASFVMNSASGSVGLVRQYGGQTIIADWVDYSLLGTNRSYGLYPDGSNQLGRQVFQYPTPGISNNPSSDIPAVYLNEWMADNGAVMQDADLKFHDWFELYNAGESAVNLAGFQLSGGITGSNRCVVPGGVYLGGKSYMLVWADKKHTVGMIGSDLYVNFGLSKSGDALWLFTPDGTVVDSVAFGPQLTDVGEGRWPDGGPDIYQMPIWTPGSSNRLFVINELGMSGGTTLLGWTARSSKEYEVWWTDSMTNMVWNSLGRITSGGNTVWTNVTIGTATQGFFKIRQN